MPPDPQYQYVGIILVNFESHLLLVGTIPVVVSKVCYIIKSS